MSRWLVTGAQGQLGGDLVAVLGDDDVIGLGRDDLDITDSEAVHEAIESLRPTVVINAAAYTAVDAAETEPEAARMVNTVGPGNVAAACAKVDALLVHLSTDYVFSGDAHTPYPEDAPTQPLSTYGRTKLLGELAVAAATDRHYIIRTSWLYGTTGNNFVSTMLRLEHEQTTIRVVGDQHGSPTFSEDLAVALRSLVISAARHGVYHCTNAGHTTWYGLAAAVFEEIGADVRRLVPVTTRELARPAVRPLYSVLSAERWHAAGLPALPYWRDALRRFLGLSPHSPSSRPQLRRNL